MIQDTLHALGLQQKEIDVYLALVQRGKMKASDVAQMAHVQRTTAYSVLKELVKKGFIQEDFGGSTHYFFARSMDDLSTFTQKEEERLTQKKQLVQDAIGELQKLANSTTYAVPKIVFITEDDLNRYLYKQTAVWNASIMNTDGVWWGFQDHGLVAQYEEWIHWYWTQAPKELIVHLLTNQSPIEKKMRKSDYAQRQMRFWKGSSGFTSTIWVNGNYIVMVMTRQRPHYLVEMYDSVFAHNLRELFKGLWQRTK